MTVPMVAWMRYRGHGWLHLVMLLRRDEYSGHTHRMAVAA